MITIEFSTVSNYADGRTLAYMPENVSFDTLDEAMSEFDSLIEDQNGEYVAKIWLGDDKLVQKRITL